MRHLHYRLLKRRNFLIVALLVLPPTNRSWVRNLVHRGAVRKAMRLSQAVHGPHYKGAKAPPRLALREPVLEGDEAVVRIELLGALRGHEDHGPAASEVLHRRDQSFEHLLADLAREIGIEGRPQFAEIGRASCRERV